MSDRFQWARLLAFVTGLVNQELLLRNEYLAAENRILRAHLVWSKNPIHMKSKDDGSRGPGGPDGSVTRRYITKKSTRNVGMASSKPA